VCEICSLTLKDKCRLRVFENRVLRRIFGTKRDEIAGKWRKVHNEELNDLYPSPNIIRVTKSRIMRWAGHVGRKVCREFWWENLRERNHLEDPGVIYRIILRWIFRKWDVGAWAGSSWLRIGTRGGHL